MNIKITHSMVQDYLDTDATPEEIQEFVSLGGPNVETVEKVGDEYIYDIEVTSNRIDAASAFGFALECAAILPRYGKKASLKTNPLEQTVLPIFEGETGLPLDITLADNALASRVMALIFSDVAVGKSPAYIVSRLKACGERSINNVVDISNYVRIMLGHPIHMFDYDKIGGHNMTIRLSKKGEKIALLDKKSFVLQGDDIIIEDGEGNIIDLAGIMGGANSEIDENSKNIILWVATFAGRPIRQTSMKLAQRTYAVAYFEKNVDPERAAATLISAAHLLTSEGKGIVAAPTIDMYPQKRQSHTVDASVGYINKLMAVDLKSNDIKELIQPLGFECTTTEDTVTVSVPSYRADDVTTQADILEEVARIYGYNKIPSAVQLGEPILQPIELHRLFNSQNTVRQYLRANGFNEQCNYSMISEKLLSAFGLSKETHLHLSNTISEEIEYMRTSLIPSLAKNITDNKGAQDDFNFFETARVYLPQEKDLPNEQERIGFATTQGFPYLKGMIENIFSLLKIDDVTFGTFIPDASENFVVKEGAATIKIGDSVVGYIGMLKPSITHKLGIDPSVTAAELYLPELLMHIRQFTQYTDRSKFALVKFDLTYTSNKNNLYADIIKKVHNASTYVRSIKVLSVYKDKVTLRMEFGYDDRNMTEEQATEELEKVKKLFTV